MSQSYIIPAGHNNLDRVTNLIKSLPIDKAWRVDINEYHPTRTHSQNNYLWGVCYKTIKPFLPGWDDDDIHEYFLGEWGGWENIEGHGLKYHRPIRRSSKLSIEEFSNYVEFLQRRCAELGIVIPDPRHEFT